MNLRQQNDVHVFGPEKRKLSDRDQPLWERILQGPSDDIMKIFLMDADEEEVSNDVSPEEHFITDISQPAWVQSEECKSPPESELYAYIIKNTFTLKI